MEKIAKYLRTKAYRVLNINYPSTKFKIDELVNDYIGPIIERECEEEYRRIHFVTHSMGGILVRYYLQKYKPHNIGRVVMLAPPNQGSEVADWLRNFFLYKWILGPAGQELGTALNSIPNQLGEVNFELGVIAGNKSINWINSLKIYGLNDGKVAVERTKLESMKDFIMVPKTHTWIMQSKEVLFQIDYFLQRGCFLRKGEDNENIPLL